MAGLEGAIHESMRGLLPAGQCACRGNVPGGGPTCCVEHEDEAWQRAGVLCLLGEHVYGCLSISRLGSCRKVVRDLMARFLCPCPCPAAAPKEQGRRHGRLASCFSLLRSCSEQAWADALGYTWPWRAGFHTFDYARHFLSCCSRMLGLEHETSRGSITIDYYGRTVGIKIMPTGAPTVAEYCGMAAVV